MHAQVQRKLHSVVQLHARVRNGLALQRDESLLNMENSSIQTAFMEFCESGDMGQAIKLLGLNFFDLTTLVGMKTKREGRTCLHLAVLAGNRGLLTRLLKKINQRDFTNDGDKQGDTALHLAVRQYRVDLVKVLLDGMADLSVKNNKGETPLCIAVKFGFLDVTKKLIKHDREAVQNLCKEKKVLHLAVELNRDKIVEFLIRKSGIIEELINQRVEGSLTKPSDNEGKLDKETINSQPIVEGDTPLHITARNKNEPIVDLLLRVRGVNKHALNSEGRKTAMDIAREVTDYHESFRIIKKLTDYPPNPKPFMYCAPEVSQEKRERAREMINKSFDDRRNTELVVAALLATMTFTVVFTVPGGFYEDADQGKVLGSPVLIGLTMFKLFIIFDCIAFFLSLFVCIMWQMASELTTEDKMLFMTVSSLLTCLSFGFNSCGFMAAVYTILAHKVKILSWVVLGNLLFITFCGIIVFIHQSVRFAVARARFHRLCGVPRLLDNFVEAVWERAEHCGLLNVVRCVDEASHDLIEGDADSEKAGEAEDEHYNCSCSSSPWLGKGHQSA